MSGAPIIYEQLELPLSPHDGTPLSFLRALRRYLDGFNPDRAQLEKQRHRSTLWAAFEKVRAQGEAPYYAARMLFPDVRLAPAPIEAERENSKEEEVQSRDALTQQEPSFPFFFPTIAPSARSARGTPLSAPALSVSPWELVSCNRGLSLFPASVSLRAGASRLDGRHQGNEVLT